MMSRIRRRYGAPWCPIPLVYSELEEWLDSKSKYEVAFLKRQFWMEINKRELQHYFKDCDHFPSLREMKKTWALIYPGTKSKIPNVIKMRQIVEMAFTIYPPQGASLGEWAPQRSTWVRPVIDGVEGQKYLLYGHPVLKETNIQVVAQLVTKAMRESKMKLSFIQTTSRIEH
uniref:Uncharacterized protein n=1 Tax=Callorhinchus milii TaxID=7868 RepID=A0A4W3IAJ1_CALMI